MSNFFTNIFGSLLGSSGSDTAIGVDIGTSAIKVVQLKKEEDNTIKLVTYGSLAVGPYVDKPVGQAAKLPINTTVEALTDLLQEAKTTTKDGGIAIPFNSTLMNVIEVPRVDEEELEEMVTIEARKYVPTPISEVHLDWTIIPGSEHNTDGTEEGAAAEEERGVKKKVDVLIVAIHNDIVERYQRIVERAELKTLFFEVEIFSTIRAVMAEEKKPVLVFDMGAASAKLYIIEQGVVRKTHTINQGSQNITEAISHALDVDVETAEILKRGMTPHGETQNRAEEVAEAAEVTTDRILTEAEKFKRSYEAHGKQLDRCILVGGGVLFQGFAEKTETHLQLPTELANPFSEFKAPSFLGDVLADNGPGFAVAAGVALRKLQG